ncbi:NADH dehydrogenase subunit 4 (mitochondrion)-like protein [Leptotrombidium deliense]|uniref:NADH dehydrogenase subunit 4 (Mitochondrion)-like protein n=1 Tax=Leptotrombidium deliense TaxID=299467 RepID=A0A443SS14_9ACAR|nr:NADH dehydrogenase subunit 4 (mitochondrion)-like protein [Leptotrombidium deliense]
MPIIILNVTIAFIISLLGIFIYRSHLISSLLCLEGIILSIFVLTSQNHLSNEPLARKKLYILILISLQVFLIITFSAIELIIFYVLFEATLIPTLIIITR